jgi:hypothetical protein
MQKRTMQYLRKEKARRILEQPLNFDLKTLLSATFALSESSVVKRHIHKTLTQLNAPSYRMSA